MGNVDGASIRSRIAGFSEPVMHRLEKIGNKNFWPRMALGLAISFIPTIGTAAGFMLHRHFNHTTAEEKKAVLAEHYKSLVAATEGIDENKVTVDDLTRAAMKNEALKGAVESVEQEKLSANRAAALGAVGAYATGAALMPVIGGVVSNGISGIAGQTIGNMAAKTVSETPGIIGGGILSSLFDKDTLTAHDVMMHLDAKAHRGEAITANDVLVLRIAQDETWQKAFAKQQGTAFHKMTEVQQQSVLNSLPNRMYAEAQESAEKVANGRSKVSDLLIPSQLANDNLSPMEVPIAANQNTPNWVDRTGGPRQQVGSFAEKFAAKGKPASFTAAVEAREATPQTKKII